MTRDYLAGGKVSCLSRLRNLFYVQLQILFPSRYFNSIRLVWLLGGSKSLAEKQVLDAQANLTLFSIGCRKVLLGCLFVFVSVVHTLSSQFVYGNT